MANEVISYLEMCSREGTSLQRGINFGLGGLIRRRGLRHPALGGRGAARRGPEPRRFRLRHFARELLYGEPRYESAGDRTMTLTPVQVALLQTSGFSLNILLAAVVNYAYYVLLAFIVAWVLIGWFPTYPSSSFLQAVYDVVGRVVDPIMRPIRSVLPPLNLGGMALDLSPVVAIFALSIARSLLLLIITGFVAPVAG